MLVRTLVVPLLAVAVTIGSAAPSGPAGAAAPAATQRGTARATGIDTWGDDSSGEQGDARLTPWTEPGHADTSAEGTSTITDISAGGRHDLALLSNGTVVAWGDDTYGQLGNGAASANDDAETPVPVASLSGVVAVAAGGEHSLALESDGTVEAWGDNEDGQLGDGTKTMASTSVRLTVPPVQLHELVEDRALLRSRATKIRSCQLVRDRGPLAHRKLHCQALLRGHPRRRFYVRQRMEPGGGF